MPTAFRRNAARVFGRRHAPRAAVRDAVTLLAALLGGSALATPPPSEDAQACREPAGVNLLDAWSSELPSHQRGAWLDAAHLRWDAPATAATVQLLLASRPSDGLRLGEPVPEAFEVQTLRTTNERDTDADTEVRERRFSHIAGRRFALSAPLPEAAWSQVQMVAALDAQGHVIAATGVQLGGGLDARFHAAEQATLGATPTRDGTDFALWAPTAQKLVLCRRDVDAAMPMTRSSETGVWTAAVAGDGPGARYAYLVDVLVPGVGLVRNRVTDPYALGLTADSQDAVVLDLDDPATQPEGWSSDARPNTVTGNTDLVVYELHVRDFSRDDESVSPANRGTYLAFTESHTQGMRHLRALADAGLTDVHLLPTYDLASVPERDCARPVLPDNEGPIGRGVQAAIGAVRDRDCYNWGYDPWHFNAPEGSYSTQPNEAAIRTREFRAMVQALHRAGLRVGLDVVYNHTMAAGQDRQSVLDRIVPGYYHRLDAEGAVTTSTCCPNTATEAMMMAKLMIESAVIWARDYRIDSFRFDLMGHQPKAAMLDLQQAVDAAAGRRIHLLGEGWNFGEVANGARFEQAAQGILNGSGIATFSDRMRDAARGGRAGDRGDALFAQGWLSGLHLDPNAAHAGRPKADTEAELRAAEALVRVGLAGTLQSYETFDADGAVKPLAAFRYGDGPAGYVSQPGEVVNYTENHDNLTLFDSNALRLPLDTSRHERARAQVLGNALVLLSQGVAYLHAGQELLRSKSLDRNSYNSGDAFNFIDWTGERSAFGIGLPPAWDNEDSWPQMSAVLARAEDIAPRNEDAQFVNAWTLSLLRVRSDSALLRLDTAEAVKAALRFYPAGDTPGLIIGHLRAAALPTTHAAHGSGELLYALNTDPRPREITVDALAGDGWMLHPALQSLQAASPSNDATDPRLAEAQLDASGRLVVPGRSALVFVR